MPGECVNRPNRLVLSITDFCNRFPVEEKWLMVPNYRTGYQWLENASLGGAPIFNLRLRTFPSLALELAFEDMERLGLRYVQGLRLELLVGELLTASAAPDGYVPAEGVRPDLVKAVTSTLLDLRLAGLEAEDLESDIFPHSPRARWLGSLLRDLRDSLDQRRLVDYAGSLRLALKALRAGRASLREGLRVAVPQSMLSGLRGLERKLWELLPEDRKEVLKDDTGSEHGWGGDAYLLRWINRPAEAPSPAGDGTVEIFRATGETNEVREVLRRCLGKGIPLDRVEVLYTDYEAYVPRLYELCLLLFPENRDDPPVTFAEGIPLRLTAPGRAFLGWIHWIREDFSQQVLADMVDDGLLATGRTFGGGTEPSRLASLLRLLPVGCGRDNYEVAFKAVIRHGVRAGGHKLRGENDEIPLKPGAVFRKEELEELRAFCSELLNDLPRDLSDTLRLLEGARRYLSERVHVRGKADQYALHLLLRRLEELQAWLDESRAVSFPLLDWLEETVMTSRILGEGPRPGRLHVAPLSGGGHSGRPWTFIVGLDDGRFPGAGLQDPLLADEERRRLSPDLATSFDRLSASVAGLSELFAGLRGRVTLSYSHYHLREDREMFPSQALLSAFRLISGRPAPTLEEFLRNLPAPASFAAAEPGEALSPDEWWMSTLGRGGLSSDPQAFLAPLYPHLARGLTATRARSGDSFTPYDGYVPEAGRDLDPASGEGPVLSANRLETYGKNPLEYFLRYVLGIEPFREHLHDPRSWLDPLQKGSLLHFLFHRFHRYLREREELPSTGEHWGVLQGMLEEEFEFWREVVPPPSPSVLQEEMAELARTAYIFLHEEELSCRDRRPFYFEVSVGMEGEGPGNPVDLQEPLEIELTGSGKVRVRGRIDRIDLLTSHGSQAFLVCDYKTGSSRRYESGNPFRGGRNVQNYLYVVMAESCLRKEHPGAEVAGFEFFFPGVREHGERIFWDSRTLREGERILRDICLGIASGCFLPSDDTSDLSFSDYREAFGDPGEVAESSSRKLACAANAALEPLRRLRGYAEESL
ncbi:PD-(D/E)XK nuclease family protein [Candidatus Solincola tengchongensis]|uniref:PD-(D/E)XK nuclease family protein n=1 Tax=Candidatus Solincola tengchongensis TaxID=2900693 RepID=UPI00257C8433|nr:PD-(D/E)XK nuclease family protein [Candidatus Solincola tengchongensis]